MKVRKGFVSNSSSSSFICEVCENVESGYDASPSDVGMCECENGHTLCQSCVPDFDSIELKKGFIPSNQCPICGFTNVSKTELLACALKRLGVSQEEFEKQIMAQFDSYVAFKDFIK